MVETVMIFALGFLAATLIALLIIPAINARADRLARRRAEALFPLSISELTAEKDHLRAEFAVMQRRLERKAEEAFAVKHRTLEELGRRAVRIEQLETGVAERDAAIGELQADLAETRSRLAATEDELAGTQAMLGATRETLEAIENAHRRTLDELATTREELDRTSAHLNATRAELAVTQERLEAREAAWADLDARHTTVVGDLDAKRITVSDLETRLAMQRARADDFERAARDRKTELAHERQQLAELAETLLAEQERAVALESRIRELEQAFAISALGAAPPGTAPAEASAPELANGSRPGEAASRPAAPIDAREPSPSGEVEQLRAERTALEGALAAAADERARLQAELERLRGDGASEHIKAENAELRRLIGDVADSVLQAARAGSPPAEDGRSEAASAGKVPATGRRKAAR